MANTEKIKKLEDKIFEIKTTVSREETVTVNSDVLDNDIRSAEESVMRRESELASAEAALEELLALKEKIQNIKK